MNRTFGFLAPLLVSLACGCAASTDPEPQPTPTPETAPTPDEGQITPQAKSKCTDNANGTTTCCTPESCVTF